MNIGKSLEDYLKAIYILWKRNGIVRSIDIADYMNFSKPSVSHAVKELRKNELLKMEQSGYLTLTESGKKIAQKIYERHCFFTSYLIEVGVHPEQAEIDACKMEHVISDESFTKLKESVLKDEKKVENE